MVNSNKKIIIKGVNCDNFNTNTFLSLRNELNKPTDILPESIDLLRNNIKDKLQSFYGKEAHVLPQVFHLETTIVSILKEENVLFIFNKNRNCKIQNEINEFYPSKDYITEISFNDVVTLEKIISENKFSKFYYFTESFCSYGSDSLNFYAFNELLERHTNLTIVLNDQRSFGWTGINGKGLSFNKISNHENWILISSFGSMVGSSIGFVLSNNEAFNRLTASFLKNIEADTIFTSENLRLANNSLNFMKKKELFYLQEALKERVQCTSVLLKHHNIDFINTTMSPEFFINIKTDKQTLISIREKLINKGFFIGGFERKTQNKTISGLKINITLFHSLELINSLVKVLNDHLPIKITDRVKTKKIKTAAFIKNIK